MTDHASAPAYIRHHGLVVVVIRRYFMPLLRQGFDFDDLIQEGLMEIWRAEPRYSPAKGKEADYYARCIYNGIKNRCHMPLTRLRRKSNLGALRLDMKIGRIDDAGKPLTLMDTLISPDADPADAATDRVMAQAYMAKITDNPRYVKAVRMRFEKEMDYRDIGAEIGLTWQGARHNVIRALEAMRA